VTRHNERDKAAHGIEAVKMREVWCIKCGAMFRLQETWSRGKRGLDEYYTRGTLQRVKHCSACGAELRPDTVIEGHARARRGASVAGVV